MASTQEVVSTQEVAAPVVVVVTRDTTRTGVAAKGGGKRTSFSRPILVGVVPVAAMGEWESKRGEKYVDSSQKTLSVRKLSQGVITVSHTSYE